MALALSIFSKRFRKAIAAVKIGIRSTAIEADASTSLISSGTGAPTDADPNGSIYLRKDATDGDDAIYARVAGAWVAILGQTA